ncbi:YncE family protein [Phenylobacterium montanum]|uniref:PQQ-binding-like beta-propeller repeat protein n=1 Tax=Phenylobacterium montanum TaxID=2823693 RepID=A0A975G2P6_9CAUL|nr:PQQ-binding-like beta-propeller repeat protein [Caulobacter sp. S6]QUD89601.1 PQQ-binding-like beta-propeller repeat protein [Caulobacter sp. S6]
MRARLAALFTGAALAVAALSASLAHAADEEPLKLVGRTELPGYSGDFDHFGVDLKGDRLFLAAEDHGTLEVFRLSTGEHLKTVTGVETPHSILFMPDQNRLLVTDSGSGMTKILDATSYAVVGSVKLTPGADSVGYDAPRGRLYVVTGGKDVDMKDCYLEEIDPTTGEEYSKVHFDSNHTEALAVEQQGDRIFINITDKNFLAVIDKKTGQVTAQWPIKEAEQNAPIAMDEAHHRLFVVTRKPGKLVVLNADSGQSIASFKAPERTDEVVFDKANGRVYVLGGEGYIGVFQEDDPDHYSELARIPSGVAAKTGILVPQLNRLFVAVSPGEAKTGAAVLQYAVAPRP